MIDQLEVLNLFKYCPETGFLMRRKSVGNCKKGSLAGTLKSAYSNAEFHVTIKKKKYPISHIICLMENGFLPAHVIYSNGNKMDNRKDNLIFLNKKEYDLLIKDHQAIFNLI